MLDMGTLHVGLVVDLSGHRVHIYDDHDVSLLWVLSQKRLLLWHGKIRYYGRSEKRDRRA